MMNKLTVIGAGAWGSALAYIFRNSDFDLTIWSKNPSIVEEINTQKRNTKYTNGKELPNLKATTDLEKSIIEADVIINAVPSYATREVFERAKEHIKPNAIVINASKGIDTKTHQLPNQVFKEILPSHAHYYSLSGPGFSAGVLSDHPTAINIAGHDHNLIKPIKQAARKNSIYLTFSSDVIGVEWGGIYKNIVAIASGFSVGLGYGENTSALIFSAGFREMVQSGITIGANLETFYEPSGVGDLMLSTSSMKSRNYSFGFYLAKEPNLQAVLAKLTGIAEGYYALQSISYLKNKYQLDLPLSTMLHEIIIDKSNPTQAFTKFLETHFE